jgi:DUF4097 and DUF4098 domain-containing protein YvlB
VTDRFPTPSWIHVDLRVPAGRVDVELSDTIETEVTVTPLSDGARDRMDEVSVTFEGDHLHVDAPENRAWIGRTPEYAVSIRGPVGSRIRLKSASADLVVRGTAGAVDVKTASGDVTVADVEGNLRVDSASADVRADSVGGDTVVTSASGDIGLGRAVGTVRAQSVSGDVRIGESHARLSVQTVSGDLRVDRLAAGSLELNAVSGDVELAVAPGIAVWLDVRSLSGDTRSELDASDGPAEGEQVVEIRGKTVSGDVRIRRAAA